ncbi:unnamed protein product [Psylliodes chrysocephalus]|uniref:Uncharacterized protein n=1 Tax=Psylliodes chrysocephalus TaxID=3402493 RepID=A0A9P0CFZ1_9CUCU|nr:unnamed protein product [Psylliodes chrysocephala]
MKAMQKKYNLMKIICEQKLIGPGMSSRARRLVAVAVNNVVPENSDNIAKNAAEEEVFLETINTQLHNDNVEFYEVDEESILSPIPAPSDTTNGNNIENVQGLLLPIEYFNEQIIEEAINNIGDQETEEDIVNRIEDNFERAEVEEEIKLISKTKRTKKNNEASTSRELRGEEETADSPDQEQESNEPAELHNLIKRKRARKHDVNPSSWFQNINKINREKGIEYSGKKKLENEWKYDIPKHKKILKNPCDCRIKIISKKIQCNIATEEYRQTIFKLFWEHMNWQERKVYIQTLVRVEPVKRRRGTNESSRRNSSFKYFLKADN